MRNEKLTNAEKDIIKVIKTGLDKTEAMTLSGELAAIDNNIGKTENLLQSLGYDYSDINVCETNLLETIKPIIVRPFSELLKEANEKHPEELSFSDIFTPEEIEANHEYIKTLNEEFNSVYRLDKVDIIISAMAGILSGAFDCALGGFIRTENGKSIPGPFSEYVNGLFDKALPPEKIKELEKMAKVTYDEVNNRTTTIPVDGLSTYFHRLVSLGHDPILGFIFGVLDMMRGTMTTLDFKGKFVIQFMDAYSDRKAQNLFEAISKVFIHMLSDVNTPAGLPVPFMALFNKLQFGSIGENDLNISEVVKIMYGQGYDFRHFCAMSVPVMITEVIVRISYLIKRLSEGYSFKDAVPFGANREKKPKLDTMLYIAHSAASAINAGKVALTKNPLNINYSQWLLFAQFSIKQLKWVIHDKPQLRDEYINEIINNKWDILYDSIDEYWKEMLQSTNVIYMM